MVFTHLAVQIFDRTGQNFDLNFNVQIFERLGVQIFVRLARFLVNEVPNRTNLRPVKNSTGSVWTYHLCAKESDLTGSSVGKQGPGERGVIPASNSPIAIAHVRYIRLF